MKLRLPTRRTARRARTGRARFVLACCGAALVTALGVTAAAYTDHATVNLGTGAPGSGVGNPRMFDIAIRDADSNLQDADTPANAAVLPFLSGTVLSEDTPVEFDATVTNRSSSIDGDLLVRVYDPDPSSGDPWAHLRFTVYLDGAGTAALTNATADSVNAADLGFTSVAAGESRQVRLSINLEAGAASTLVGKATQIGLRVDGESR